jgi:acetate---CoA ligase (ADP-forming)
MRAQIDDLLFRPQSIAIVGASDDPVKISGRPLSYLLRYGYDGLIYAVNSRRAHVQGVRAHACIADVCARVDLALVVVPAAQVLTVLRECAAAGAGAAVVFASGFAETGAAGAALQRQLTELSAETKMRIVGPNCLGTFAAPEHVFATFSSAFDDAETAVVDSPIALVSQSGAVGTFTYSALLGLGAGVRYFANTGNEADVHAAELLAALAETPGAEILLGYLEGVKDPVALGAAARRARSHDKPLVLLKAGRTESGRRAVSYHTAADAGSYAAFRTLAAEHGAVVVDGIEPWLDAAIAFLPGRRARGNRMAIVTQSGGAGALATDAAVAAGLTVPEWSPGRRAGLTDAVPLFGSARNPIDLTGSLLTDPDLLAGVLQSVAADEATDVISVVLGNSDGSAGPMTEAITAAYRATSKPMSVAWTGGNGVARRQLRAAGIPVYSDPGRAVRAMARVVEHSSWGSFQSDVGGFAGLGGEGIR